MCAEAEEVLGDGCAEHCEVLVGRVLASGRRQRGERQEKGPQERQRAALERQQRREPRVGAAVERVRVQLEQEERRHGEDAEQSGFQHCQEKAKSALQVYEYGAVDEHRRRREFPRRNSVGDNDRSENYCEENAVGARERGHSECESGGEMIPFEKSIESEKSA